MNDNMILNDRFTEDHILKCAPVNLKDEVWNPKSPHFLDFEHFKDSDESQGGLTAVNKVTHGFKMNRNKRIYAPRELSIAANNVLIPYPAPVKDGHSKGFDDGPVIGRVVRAKFIPKKDDSVIDVNQINRLKPTDKAFHQAVQDAAKKGFFGKDNGGSGYLEGVSKITDKDAIEKILDGRLMTVSIEMMTSKWIDPGSGLTWDYDLMSKYVPGKFDEDKVFHALLATDLHIEGWAYVTHPADREAVLLGSMKDSIVQEFKEMSKTPTFYFGNIKYNDDKVSIVDSLEGQPKSNGEGSMKIKEYKAKLEAGETSVNSEDVHKELYGDGYVIPIMNGLTYKGITVASKAALDALISEFGESPELDKVSIVLDAMLDGKDTLVKTTDVNLSASNSDSEEGNVSSDNNTNDSGPEQKVEDNISMNLDTVLEFIKSNKDEVLAKLEVVSVDRVKELEDKLATAELEKVEALKKAESSAKDSVAVTVLRDELRSMGQEILAGQSMFNKLSSDSNSLIDRFASVLEAVGCELALEDSMLVTRLNKVTSAIDSLDLDAIKAKVNALGKEPTAELNVEKPATSSEDSFVYNKEEIIAARNYGILLEDSGPIAAGNYWSKQIKKGFVRPQIKAKEVLDSLK